MKIKTSLVWIKVRHAPIYCWILVEWMKYNVTKINCLVYKKKLHLTTVP